MKILNHRIFVMDKFAKRNRLFLHSLAYLFIRSRTVFVFSNLFFCIVILKQERYAIEQRIFLGASESSLCASLFRNFLGDQMAFEESDEMAYRPIAAQGKSTEKAK